MQSAVDYHCKGQIWFPELMNQLQNFDVAFIGSDNDLGDAYGIALMQDSAEEIQPRNLKEINIKDRMQITDEWTTDENGDIVPKQSGGFISEDQDHPSRWR